MTLPVLLAHVAARRAVTRAPAHGWVLDESETEMTDRKMYALTDDAAKRLELYARKWGSVASNQAADQLIPVGDGTPERAYTREDLARAWAEGYRSARADIAYASLIGYPGDTPNPYEQEEA